MSKKEKSPEPIVALDPVSLRALQEHEAKQTVQENEMHKSESPDGVLEMIVKSLKAQEKDRVQRMAFEVDPQSQGTASSYAGLYRNKSNLTPDSVIKKIIGPGGDDLVTQILQARSNMISSFGRPRASRFSVGFQFEEMNKKLIPEEKETYEEMSKEIDHLKELFWNCGKGPLADEYVPMNLSQCLKMLVRDGVAYGRFACELIWHPNPKTGEKELYAFRPVDAGTIYKVLPKKEQEKSVRQNAIRLLNELKNEKLDPQRYMKDEYQWVQVIDNRPVQAFTESELAVFNLYPVTNVEYNGYPLTPIDQALNAITTHINITMHNKLYFQNGRASRGMLVFKSDSIDEGTIQKIRLQFHASINSTANAWRMPVFAVGSDDDVSWQSIDMSGRDAEFQYLMDNNARVILSAFQMSPEELPGYAHLARGTNTQSLSETSNEWKLTAARDVGLRPLMYDVQDFLNTHIFPKFNQKISKSHQIVLAGLEHDDPEKEATRLQQDSQIHMTYNEIMEQVEKEKLKKELGGDFPLNPQYQAQVLSPYLTVGEILENFFGRKGAAQDPRFAYYRDPYYIQFQQLMLQKAQMAMQNQMMQQQAMQQQMMAQQQAAQGGDPQAQGQDQGQEQPGQEMQAPDQGQQAAPPAPGQPTEKTEQWLANNYLNLEKSIKGNHDTLSKMILKRHKEVVKTQMEKWKEDSRKAMNEMKDILAPLGKCEDDDCEH